MNSLGSKASNAEIDYRMRMLEKALPDHAALRKGLGIDGVQTELELLNMQFMFTNYLLGELVKRLPVGGVASEV